MRCELSRGDLIAKMNEVSSKLLREQGYMSFVDVLIGLGRLTQEDYEGWRFRRIPCLEQVITINLAKVNTLLRPSMKTRSVAVSERAEHLSWAKHPSVGLGSAKAVMRTSKRRTRRTS